MKLSAPIYVLKRHAKLIARQENIPLHQALDKVAQSEGFNAWSLLLSRCDTITDTEKLARSLRPGDMVLLGGRPGQGKTKTGLAIASSKIRSGHDAHFFTLEYHTKELNARLSEMGSGEIGASSGLIVDTSDEICADHIIKHMAGAKAGTVAVIDYLQILDQRRSTPELDIQLKHLQQFAQQRDVTLVLISQVDRAFEQTGKSYPDITDIRQPNFIDLKRFSRACFVHENRLRWNIAA